MSEERLSQFKDSTSLTLWGIRGLYLSVALDACAVISNVLEYQLLSDFKEGVFLSEELAVAAATASDDRQAMIGFAQILLVLVVGVLVLRWTHRANHNARQLGAGGMVFTPGWSVGWYFVPIMNLWKPYQAMKEIWKASANPRAWSDESVPSLVSWWWLFWVITCVAGNAAFRMGIGAEELDEMMRVNTALQIADAASIVAALCLLQIMNSVQSMQLAHANSEQGLPDSIPVEALEV